MIVIGRSEQVIDMVDALLKECAGREIVSASQIADALLDIRMELTRDTKREEEKHETND